MLGRHCPTVRVDIDFAYLAYQTGIYNATDMQRFGNTIQKKLIKSDGTIANRVDGSGTSANQNFIGLWLNFHTWHHPYLIRHIKKYRR
jgi:hypothetical protein